MKQSSKHLMVLGAISFLLTVLAFWLFHNKLEESLSRIDFFWLKLVLSLLCGLLFFFACMEIYHFYFYPTARRIILRTIGMIFWVGFCGAAGPWIVFSLQTTKGANGVQAALSFDKAGQQSTTTAVASIIAILILVYWYIQLLKWEEHRNGKILA